MFSKDICPFGCTIRKCVRVNSWFLSLVILCADLDTHNFWDSCVSAIFRNRNIIEMLVLPYFLLAVSKLHFSTIQYRILYLFVFDLVDQNFSVFWMFLDLRRQSYKPVFHVFLLTPWCKCSQPIEKIPHIKVCRNL